MTDLERVRDALEATWHDECPADYEPYPVQILNAHLKEDAERDKTWRNEAQHWADRAKELEAELAELREAVRTYIEARAIGKRQVDAWTRLRQLIEETE